MFRTTVTLALLLAVTSPAQSYLNFESPQTHPVAITADGERLCAVNTDGGSLSVFSLLRPDRPVLVAEIPVGLEPVSVAARTCDEVWVVNRLSDSVSVVSIRHGAVVRTIPVGDEPADIAFAGDPECAFVSVAGRREVLVLDPDSSERLAAVPIFGDEPRALAVGTRRQSVLVAVHRSGNRTTIVPEDLAPAPPAPANAALPAPPRQGILVDSEDPAWRDVLGAALPDLDVFEIDAGTHRVVRGWAGVGTVLFDLAVHPATGEVFVANTDARNLVRFEPALRGHAVDNRLTRLAPGDLSRRAFFDLNPGVDYEVLPNDAARATALAQPTGLAFAPDGAEIFVAAFGTDRVGVFDRDGRVLARVELGAPGAKAHPREKRGPRGLVHHPARALLYVLNRLSATLAVVDTKARRILREVPLGHDPTPAAARQGRGFLYDARLSGNGTMSCASCHVGAEHDGLAWDLGDPGGAMQRVDNRSIMDLDLHPMKGPMTTQTLRGLTRDTHPFHHRGDRPGLSDFNRNFDDLLGGDPLAPADLDVFVAFLETIVFPPNPNQSPDRTYPATPRGESARDGFELFTDDNFLGMGALTCAICHAGAAGTGGVTVPGGLLHLDAQPFKTAQLRNVYKRLGRTPVDGLRRSGFGLLHDGRIDSVDALLQLPFFRGLTLDAPKRRALERFVLAFDTGTAPAVGRSVTVPRENARAADVARELDLLESQAAAGSCDLVVQGAVFGHARGYLFDASLGQYLPDAAARGPLGRDLLLDRAARGEALLTFLAVPPGSGRRIGIDRDLDSVLDADEGLAPFGESTPGCAGPLWLDGASAPRVGMPGFALFCRGAPSSSSGFAVIGPRHTTEARSGMTLLVDLSAAWALAMASDSAGGGVTELPVPNAAALLGSALHAQAVFLSPCAPGGVAASDGLAIVLQR